MRTKLQKKPDFARIGTAALTRGPDVLGRLLPGGRRHGREWVARNPTRQDARPGSFKINMQSGRWADFATGARGGDIISLAAYIASLSQTEAARRLANMLGMDDD